MTTKLENAAQQQPLIPLHQWTHNGDRVLLVKCVDKGGKGYGGFDWPRSGTACCPTAKDNRAEAAEVTGDQSIDCASGGLFGWPWGANLGVGKIPDYDGDWIVFSADPADCIDLGDKAKAIGEVGIVYYGDATGALMHTFAGRLAWSQQATINQDKHSTDDKSAVSGTGNSSAVSGTGHSSAVSGTGCGAIAAITGEDSTIEVGEKSLGAVTAQSWIWKVRKGAAVACRWQEDGTWNQRLLVADELGFDDGIIVGVVNGQLTRRQA